MDKKTAAQKSGSQTRKHHSTIPSQRERILAVLQSGQSLTAYEMHQMGIMGCNARILELRRAGYQALRFAPAMPYWLSDGRSPALLGHYPAMLAAIEREGELQGLHITYLQADYPKPCGEDGLHSPEWRKLTASHPDTGEALPAKKMKARYAGALNGAAVHLGTPDRQGRLLAAEGIETALAASALFGLPAAACLSAHGLSAFDWPPETRELYIAADNDLSRTGIKAAEALARRAHAAGLTVKIWQPDKAGTDALDEWNVRKGRLKTEGAAQ